MNAFIFEKLAAHRRSANTNKTKPQSAKEMADAMHKNMADMKKALESVQNKAKAPPAKDAAQPKSVQPDNVQEPVTPKINKR